MGCRPISSRLITMRLIATPFNITIIQAYAPTSDYDDELVEEFYEQLEEATDQERHPCCPRRLDCQDRRRRTQKLDWHMRTILQQRNERKRHQALRICQLQRPHANKHVRPTQSIQKMDLSQPKWRTPQPN